VRHNLTRTTGWEAVMRIRCSKGLRISAFHGHFFIRSTDLLALPQATHPAPLHPFPHPFMDGLLHRLEDFPCNARRAPLQAFLPSASAAVQCVM
jgi:hypothetical protein